MSRQLNGAGFEKHTLSRIVQSCHGPIQGYVHDGMERFLGVPYASPPVGPLRWQPPAPPQPWTQTLQAVSFGPICAQSDNSLPGFGSNSRNEDCLYLNVFRPSSPALPVAGQKLPVIVWIHGGGFAGGASNDYDPSSLVKHGNVVFVSFNYRVGCFGFFSHPAINAEGHRAGNYGIMDQQLALVWVKENILQFGGNPDNITCMGESAGGASLLAHMAAPSSHGLFHKAIVQSGGSPPSMPFPTIEKLEAVGIALTAAAGRAEVDQTPENLRLISAGDLLDADELPAGVFGIGKFPFGLMEDGQLIPKDLRGVFASGQIQQIPVLIGVNADEFAWFQAMIEMRSGRVIPKENFSETIATTLDVLNKLHLNGVIVPESAIPEIISMYPMKNAVDQNPSRALAAIVGDAGLISTAGRRTTRLLAKHCPVVYAYEFDVPDTPCPWPEVSFPYGSAHTLELPYIFPGFRGATGKSVPLSASQLDLATLMVHYWTTFAHTGTPNASKTVTSPQQSAAAIRQPSQEWLPYEAGNDNVMLFQAAQPSRMIEHWGRRHNSDFWDAFY